MAGQYQEINASLIRRAVMLCTYLCIRLTGRSVRWTIEETGLSSCRWQSLSRFVRSMHMSYATRE